MNSASLRKNGEKIMNKKTILCALAALFLFPALARAQTGPAGSAWGLDYQNRAIVAVLPLAGEETETALQFYRGIMEAVAALEKYNPQETSLSAFPGPEIPTDMPPNRDLVVGARYALTGGVYPGNRSGDYYLQLWLWDMRGSTMIYTDDLVYVDVDTAMESVPGLVEWLFSHIREVPLEKPEPVSGAVLEDPLFTVGLKAGFSPRWFIEPGEISFGARAFAVDGGVFGSFRLTRLFSLQAEILFTEDTLVERGLRSGSGTEGVLLNDKFKTLSLMFPLLFKVNFRLGSFRLSPLAGLYLMAPLGKAQYRRNTEDKGHSFSWSYSIPLGFTLGFEAAVQSGPGFLMAGLRYAGDIGAADIDFGNVVIHYDDKTSREKEYRRRMVSLYVGYAFGFSDRR
jgi:hypothetical protein